MIETLKWIAMAWGVVSLTVLALIAIACAVLYAWGRMPGDDTYDANVPALGNISGMNRRATDGAVDVCAPVDYVRAKFDSESA